MIKSSFLFIPGIGDKSEEAFWKAGILTWDDFEEHAYPLFRNQNRGKLVRDYLTAAKNALREQRSSFFAEQLPQKEYWRLYKEFQKKTLFLDIETTGLSLYYDVITLIGTYDGNNYKLFIKDHNLGDIKDYVKKFEILVTFNGKLFDVPFIKKEFPNIIFPSIHIDLRFVLKSIGLTGPLKNIEKELKIDRGEEIQQINGRGATVLWSRFLKGDYDSLKKLTLYNIYDTKNLENIMQLCYLTKVGKNILPKIKDSSKQRRLFKDSKKINIDYNLISPNIKIPHVDVDPLNRVLEIQGENTNIIRVDRSKIKRVGIKINDLIGRIESKQLKPLSVGIDLSGSENKASGFCILDEKKAYLSTIKTDEEVISLIREKDPAIISIDSPLSLPKNRCCADDSCECRKYGITRECERILKRRGINVYPCLIKSMQGLTLRGIRLSKMLAEHGYHVIESYPGAAQDILRFPRKRIDLKELEIDLMNMGIRVISNKNIVTHDEIDALTSALVGYFCLAGTYEAIGNAEEGYLIIPDIYID